MVAERAYHCADSRVFHHGACGDDDRGASAGQKVLPQQTFGKVCLRDAGAVVCEHFRRRDAYELRGAAGADGCRDMGLEHAVHDGALRLEVSCGYFHCD